MAQTYTIEEAAAKLEMSVADFNRKLRTEWVGKVIPFRDGTTIRFKVSVIDELARTLGLGSSEELQLSEPDELPGEIGLLDDNAPPKAPEQTQAVSRPKTTPPKKDEPLVFDDALKVDSDDVFLLSPEETAKPVVKPGSDSDVRLEKAGQPKKDAKKADDEESILTDEFDLPTGSSTKLTGKSGKLSSTKLMSSSDSGKSKKPAPAPEPDSSEFELSLAPDSDEFELSLTPDSSEEVSLGDAPDPKANKAGQSGINLNRPADSGVSLEKKGKPPAKQPAAQADSDEEIDFELSLDAPGSGKSATKFGSSKRLQADSDSEFELTLEEPSDLALEPSDGGITAEKKDDIFEATDFEIPALDDDSASEAVALDEGDTDLESSDFDLDLDGTEATGDDSESQVVALDDDDEPKPKAKSKAKKKSLLDTDDDDVVNLDDMELEEGSSASSALRGVKSDDDDDLEVTEAAEDDERTVVVAEAAPWGAMPALLMFPTLLMLFFGVIMAYELLHSVWGYQQPNKPTTPLVNWAAETAGMKPGQ